MAPPIKRPGIDQDPVVPWQWGLLVGRDAPVELVSYPIPAIGRTEIDRDATIMVRMNVGEPGSIREVPLKALSVFAPDRHEWYYRPKRYYDEGISVFVFTDE